MATIYKSVSSAAVHTLIAKGTRVSGNINKIVITNHDDSDNCALSIVLNDGAGSPTIIVLYETLMPARTSLVLTDNIKFNSSEYNLQLVTGSTADITAIIT
tara:strand:+ start:212 stop:514 length:303 start_codon:yes stop_codon:yes gene_type:complete